MERKRVTLHPLKEDGSMDLNVNLYPKTLLSGIVDDNGEEVAVVTEDELEDIDEKVDDKQDKLISGETIKTVNGQSILGEGNIEISVDLSDYPTNEDMEEALADKQEELVSGESIRTINGQDVLGSGNISITTYQAFPAAGGDYTGTNVTTKQFCDVVDADNAAVIGMGYFGGARWSDKPAGLANGDVVVEILEGPNQTKAIHLVMTSSTVAPYRGEYTYWSHGSVSGGRGVQPELISGTNIKTVNNESLLGSGNIAISGGTTVEANPEVSGKEDSLTSIKIGERSYIVEGGGGGSSVVPNPDDLDPYSDTGLNGLKINNTNYYIPTREAIEKLSLSDEHSYLYIDEITDNNNFSALYDFIESKMFPGDEENYPEGSENGSPIFLLHYGDIDEITLIPGMLFVHDYSGKGEPQDATLRNISSLYVDIICSNGYVSLNYAKSLFDRYAGTILENTLDGEKDQPTPSEGSSLSIKGLDCGNKYLVSLKGIVAVNDEDESDYYSYDEKSEVADFIPSYLVANGYNEPIKLSAFEPFEINPRTGVAEAELVGVRVITGSGKDMQEHLTRYYFKQYGLDESMLFISVIKDIPESTENAYLVLYFRRNEE